MTIWRPLFAAVLVLLPVALASADESDELWREAQQAIAAGKSAEGVRLLTGLTEHPRLRSTALYHRGREHFRLGKVQESVADFDRHVELSPDREPQQWERGISLYYAGEFDRGAKQFELYQTFHDADVENAVWRYLCVAKGRGHGEARRSLLPIEGDRRAPLMEIYALFQGKKSPEEVLAAARAGDPPAAALSTRLFYAHLYIGLWHDAHGRVAEARPHLQAAAEKHPIDHYMADVARLHWGRLKEKNEPASRD